MIVFVVVNVTVHRPVLLLFVVRCKAPNIGRWEHQEPLLWLSRTFSAHSLRQWVPIVHFCYWQNAQMNKLVAEKTAIQ